MIDVTRLGGEAGVDALSERQHRLVAIDQALKLAG